MPETVTGADLRARADGLRTVIEGDSNTFNREALVSILNDLRGDLANAANMLERHEKDARDREQPQNLGAGSGQPTTALPSGAPVGAQMHPAGTAPSHVPGDDRVPATNTPHPAPPQQAEAASDRDRDNDKASGKGRKDRTES